MSDTNDQQEWERIVTAVRAEFAALGKAERSWIATRLTAVEGLQTRMHGFFEKADGTRLCSACAGECCARGKHHLTLVNLLSMLRSGCVIPKPDFASTCPFLGPAGCLLAVAWRPFNCVTFLCGEVEDRLARADREVFYALERELRARYGEFEQRYAGAGMCGLMIRADRLGSRPFLSPARGRGESRSGDPPGARSISVHNQV